MTHQLAGRAGLRVVVLALILVVAACSGSAAPTASPATVVTTPDQAAALVLAQDPRFEGIGPRDPDIIGGCCFYEATAAGDGFEVKVEIGWGDCLAGCIDRHDWTYAVSRDGRVTLLGETGDPVPAGVGGPGGGNGGGGGILPGGSGIAGRAVGGPTCPVEQVGDPACDERPLPGATVLVLDARGMEVARVLTDADGAYAVVLPPGDYVLEPQPVEGMMRTAEPIPVSITDGVVTVDLVYDTGIR